MKLSNIELCRIVSILLVMLVHTTFATFGWETQSLGIQTLAAFTIIGVNVFVLITGYFSATLKKTTLVNLAFICFFWNTSRRILGISHCDRLLRQYCNRPIKAFDLQAHRRIFEETY